MSLVLTQEQFLNARVTDDYAFVMWPRRMTDGRFAMSEAALTNPHFEGGRATLEAGSIEAVALGDFVAQNAAPFIVVNGKLLSIEAAQNGWGLTAPATNIQRFELRYNDTDPAKADEVLEGRHRTELSNNIAADFMGDGVDIWVSFSMRVRQNTGFLTAQSFAICGQLHAIDPDVPRSPSMAFNMTPAGKLDVRTCSSAALVEGGNGQVIVRYTSSWSVVVDQWYAVVARILTGAAGELELWVNGVQELDFAGPIGYYADALPQGWWKYGIYGSNVAGTSILEYANMEWGTTDLTARIATPLAI